jgi:hypothetical protein
VVLKARCLRCVMVLWMGSPWLYPPHVHGLCMFSVFYEFVDCVEEFVFAPWYFFSKCSGYTMVLVLSSYIPLELLNESVRISSPLGADPGWESVIGQRNLTNSCVMTSIPGFFELTKVLH